MKTEIDKSRIKAYLARGVRNAWYPVVPSWRVSEAPLGITRLGENIVLWRDATGEVHALEDRCPHRGARLSLGWNLGDRVACWYHGIEINGNGRIVDVPAVESCPMTEERCVRAWPVTEAHGAIFLWFGDDLHREAPPLEFPEQLASPEWGSMLCTAHWKCNWQFAVDNVMDPMHGAYLHAASHSMAEGDRQAEMRTRKTPQGLVFEKVGQRDVNFDWVEWGESDSFWMRLAIPYKKRFGPGGQFYIIGYATPVDDENCMVFFWRCRKAEGWQRDVWRFMYRNRLEGLHWTVLEQDRVVLEDMAPDPRSGEYLYQHDAGMVRIRRRLEEVAREHLTALDEAQAVAPAPAGPTVAERAAATGAA
jgi:phenylpropionate dioxygenase-like ring-hydroxylating dioxygenase large terminal subunit